MQVRVHRRILLYWSCDMLGKWRHLLRVAFRISPPCLPITLVSVHMVIGFNVKLLCQRVENASFHHYTKRPSPVILPSLERMRKLVSIILPSAPPPPPHLALMLTSVTPFRYSPLVFPMIRIFMIDLNRKSTLKKIKLIEKSAKKKSMYTGI